VAAATAAILVRTFMFHLGLTLIPATILAAILRRRWMFAAAGLLAVVCLWPPTVARPSQNESVADGRTITVMSVNLLGVNRRTQEMIEEIRAVNPDLLLLQEYRPHWHEAFQSASFARDYPHNYQVIRPDNFGQAVYSRRPCVPRADDGAFPERIRTPYTRFEIRIGEREAAVYNVHLAPPAGVTASLRQRLEFADLLESAGAETVPTIIAGDFNFTNAAPFANELARLGLIDTHLLIGAGRGSTWPNFRRYRWAPGLRLDHVFISNEWTSLQSGTGAGPGSDHRPVITKLRLK